MISMSTAEAAELLGTHCIGDATFAGVSTDSRQMHEGELFVALRGPTFDGHVFVPAAGARGASAVMVDAKTECSVPSIVVEDTRQALLSLAENWRDRFDVPFAAVTGSNGKTTVKEFLAAICALQAPVLKTQGNLNNDVGVPLTLFGLDDHHRAAVVELGANHAGEIRSLAAVVKPRVGIITQCAPAHLEGFGTIDAVARAKGELFEQVVFDGTVVVNADDNFADFWRALAGPRKVLSFGLCETADVSATWCINKRCTRMILLTPQGVTEVNLKLPGRHNVMNALAAAAAALALGIGLDDIASGLETVQPLKGRLAPVDAPGELVILDDTYNANPISLKAGLEVLSQYSGQTWLIMGDMAELGDGEFRFHEEAGALAREYGVAHLFATGERCRHAVAAFGEGARHFDQQTDLIDAVRNSVDPGATVLVKGSRSMHMERVVDALARDC